MVVRRGDTACARSSDVLLTAVDSSSVTVTPGRIHSLPSRAAFPFRSNQTIPCTAPSASGWFDGAAVVGGLTTEMVVEVVDGGEVVVVLPGVSVVAGAVVDVVVGATAVVVVVAGAAV